MTEENTESEPIIIDLDQDTYDALIEIYVNEHFSKESISVFNDYRIAGENHICALSRGVINEMVIETLTEQLARDEFAKKFRRSQIMNLEEFLQQNNAV